MAKKRLIVEDKPRPQDDLSTYLTHPITFLFGQAGTGKTDLATRIALNHLTKGGKKIVVCRPMVACDGEEIGYLPGDISSKTTPWLMPFNDVLARICGDEKIANKVLHSFEHVPIGLIRGRTFADCTAILDESQNCTKEQLRAFCTRLGKNGRVVICGDSSQSDLPERKQCLEKVAWHLESAGIASIHRLTKNYRTEDIVKIEECFSRI